DEAKIMPYYLYMCDMIPGSEHWRLSLAEAQRLQQAIMGYLPGFATPRIVCDVPYVGKRWVHQVNRYDTALGISSWTNTYGHLQLYLSPRYWVLGRCRSRAQPLVPLLRPDLCAARAWPAVVARP